jgi:hypothetical protein
LFGASKKDIYVNLSKKTSQESAGPKFTIIWIDGNLKI